MDAFEVKQITYVSIYMKAVKAIVQNFNIDKKSSLFRAY